MKTEWLLPPAQRTLPALLERQGRLFGERAFLSGPGAEWRHADAAARCARPAWSRAIAWP
jgi:carnitine-CoA ligase